MKFFVLGPLELQLDKSTASLGSLKQRTVLGWLLLHANRPVPVDQIIDAVWGDRPPQSAAKNIQMYVWKLRKLLGRELQTAPSGYCLEVGRTELDLWQFDDGVAAARAARDAGQLSQAVHDYDTALSLWRGPAFTDLEDSPALRSAAVTLEQHRIQALEERNDVQLDLGRHADSIPSMQRAVADHPLHERFREQQILGLCRSGRTAEAWAAYHDAEQVLSQELGVAPGPGLQRLQDAMAQGVASSGAVVAAGAQPQHESTATQQVRPRQLPPAPATFTGRQVEAATLRDQLQAAAGATSAPVWAITGPGGAGKSTLALHVGHQLANDYPDGQLYVDLRGATTGSQPLSSAAALSRFLKGLGTPDEAIAEDLDEAVAQYRSLLADRRVLVLLDNAADAEQVRRLLPAGRGCAALITARRPLAELDGAGHLELGHLSESESVQLLSRLAGDGRIEADPDGVRQVVEWTEGLPLAVRLAGSRLAVRPRWSVATLAGRLADSRRRLAELQLGDIAVRTSFMASYQSLYQIQSARAFRLLGLLEGPHVTPVIVAALLDRPESVAQGALDELVDARLLEEIAPTAYRMHDLLRLFAQERAEAQESAQERQAAVRRALHCYLDAAKQAVRQLYPEAAEHDPRLHAVVSVAGGDPVAAGQWIESELPNLAAAVRCAAGSDSPESAAVAPTLSAVLARFLRDAGKVPDWIEVSLHGSRAARKLRDRPAEAELLGQLSEAYFLANRCAEAAATLQRCLTVQRKLGDLTGVAGVMNRIGVIHIRQTDYDKAAKYLRRSLSLYQRLGDHNGEVVTRANLGALYTSSQYYDKAIHYHQSVLDKTASEENPRVRANALNNLGEVCIRKGDPDAALQYLERSRAIQHDIGNRVGEGSALSTLADAYAGAGRTRCAVEYAEAGLKILRASGYRWGEATALRRLGLLWRDLDDLCAARDYLQAAVDLFTVLDAAETAETQAALRQLDES